MYANENPVAGVARAAMLVDLQISLYSGRKQDKATQAEVTASNCCSMRFSY